MPSKARSLRAVLDACKAAGGTAGAAEASHLEGVIRRHATACGGVGHRALGTVCRSGGDAWSELRRSWQDRWRIVAETAGAQHVAARRKVWGAYRRELPQVSRRSWSSCATAKLPGASGGGAREMQQQLWKTGGRRSETTQASLELSKKVTTHWPPPAGMHSDMWLAIQKEAAKDWRQGMAQLVLQRMQQVVGSSWQHPCEAEAAALHEALVGEDIAVLEQLTQHRQHLTEQQAQTLLQCMSEFSVAAARASNPNLMAPEEFRAVRRTAKQRMAAVANALRQAAHHKTLAAQLDAAAAQPLPERRPLQDLHAQLHATALLMDSPAQAPELSQEGNALSILEGVVPDEDAKQLLASQASLATWHDRRHMLRQGLAEDALRSLTVLASEPPAEEDVGRFMHAMGSPKHTLTLDLLALKRQAHKLTAADWQGVFETAGVSSCLLLGKAVEVMLRGKLTELSRHRAGRDMRRVLRSQVGKLPRSDLELLLRRWRAMSDVEMAALLDLVLRVGSIRVPAAAWEDPEGFFVLPSEEYVAAVVQQKLLEVSPPMYAAFAHSVPQCVRMLQDDGVLPEVARSLDEPRTAQQWASLVVQVLNWPELKEMGGRDGSELIAHLRQQVGVSLQPKPADLQALAASEDDPDLHAVIEREVGMMQLHEESIVTAIHRVMNMMLAQLAEEGWILSGKERVVLAALLSVVKLPDITELLDRSQDPQRFTKRFVLDILHQLCTNTKEVEVPKEFMDTVVVTREKVIDMERARRPEGAMPVYDELDAISDATMQQLFSRCFSWLKATELERKQLHMGMLKRSFEEWPRNVIAYLLKGLHSASDREVELLVCSVLPTLDSSHILDTLSRDEVFAWAWQLMALEAMAQDVREQVDLAKQLRASLASDVVVLKKLLGGKPGSDRAPSQPSPPQLLAMKLRAAEVLDRVVQVEELSSGYDPPLKERDVRGLTNGLNAVLELDSPLPQDETVAGIVAQMKGLCSRLSNLTAWLDECVKSMEAEAAVLPNIVPTIGTVELHRSWAQGEEVWARMTPWDRRVWQDHQERRAADRAEVLRKRERGEVEEEQQDEDRDEAKMWEPHSVDDITGEELQEEPLPRFDPAARWPARSKVMAELYELAQRMTTLGANMFRADVVQKLLRQGPDARRDLKELLLSLHPNPTLEDVNRVADWTMDDLDRQAQRMHQGKEEVVKTWLALEEELLAGGLDLMSMQDLLDAQSHRHRQEEQRKRELTLVEQRKKAIAQARDEFGRAHGVGKRKSSRARVWLGPGTGKVSVNERALDDYFQHFPHRQIAMAPLSVVEESGTFDVVVNVRGGGLSAQAQAVRHGIAVALQTWSPEQFRDEMRAGDFVTRDARKVERQKPGQSGARRKFQWVKR